MAKRPTSKRLPSYGLAAQRAAERAGYVKTRKVQPPPRRKAGPRQPAKYRQPLTRDQAYVALGAHLTRIARQLETLHRKKDKQGRRIWHGGRLKPYVALSPGPGGTIDGEIRLGNLHPRFAHNRLRLLLGDQRITLGLKGTWLSGFQRVELPPGETAYIDTPTPSLQGKPDLHTTWRQGATAGALIKQYQAASRRGWKREDALGRRLPDPFGPPGAAKPKLPGYLGEIGWRWHWSPTNHRPLRRK